MDLRQLRALVSVADHGSFSAAAEALQTVQSNISAHVSRLEKELGVELIDRATRRLTPGGEAVASRARRIEAELEAAAADVAALRHEVSGVARIGVIGTTARWLVPQLLDLSADRFPALQLDVSDGTSATLDVALHSGRLDLAVGPFTPPAPELSFTPLFEEDLVLVVAEDDPLAGAASVSLSDLDGRRLLLPAPGTTFREEIDTAAATAGARITPRATIDGTRLLAGLTFEGYGPAILPATAIPNHVPDHWLAVPVRDLRRRRVGVLMRRMGLPSAPARAVFELIVEVIGEPTRLPKGLRTLVVAGQKPGLPSVPAAAR